MAPSRIEEPFALGPVEEIHLENSPLALVVLQIQFPAAYSPMAAAIAERLPAAALREEYPYHDLQPEVQIVFEAGRRPQQHTGSAHVLTLRDAEAAWMIAFKEDSITVATRRYVDRADLLARARRIFIAMQAVVGQPQVSRVGLRYINRITDLADINTLTSGFNETIQPMQTFALTGGAGMRHFQNRMLYAWEDTGMKLQTWWGTVPPKAPVAASLPAHDATSWVLDIDAIDETDVVLDPKELTQTLATLSEQAYRFFRWIFTPAGLAQFGIAS